MMTKVRMICGMGQLAVAVFVVHSQPISKRFELRPKISAPQQNQNLAAASKARFELFTLLKRLRQD